MNKKWTNKTNKIV